MIINIFLSFAILFIKFSCNFNEDIVCLDFLVCAFVGLGEWNSVASAIPLGVNSGVCSGFEI